jgi:hypothetical protein
MLYNMPYGEWKSVREKLPTNGIPVLVFEKADDKKGNSPMHDTFRIASYREYDRTYVYHVPYARPSEYFAENVTHWMPLPDKPL